MNSLRSYCDIYFTLQLQNQNFSEISKVKFLFLSPLPFLFPSSSSILKPLRSSSLWNYGEALVQGHWWIPKSMYAQVANVKWAVCKNRGQTLVRHGLPCFLSKAIEPVGKEVRERKNFMSLVSQQIKITVIKHLAPTYWAAPWTYSRFYNLHQWGGPLLQIRKLRPFNADKVTHFTQLKSNAMWTWKRPHKLQNLGFTHLPPGTSPRKPKSFMCTEQLIGWKQL